LDWYREEKFQSLRKKRTCSGPKDLQKERPRPKQAKKKPRRKATRGKRKKTKPGDKRRHARGGKDEKRKSRISNVKEGLKSGPRMGKPTVSQDNKNSSEATPRKTGQQSLTVGERTANPS